MDDLTIKSYEEFKDDLKEPKYFGQTCFVMGCNNPAEYEGGDSRWYCGYCEKCADIKGLYELYVKKQEHKKKIREMWRKFY